MVSYKLYLTFSQLLEEHTYKITILKQTHTHIHTTHIQSTDKQTHSQTDTLKNKHTNAHTRAFPLFDISFTLFLPGVYQKYFCT